MNQRSGVRSGWITVAVCWVVSLLAVAGAAAPGGLTREMLANAEYHTDWAKNGILRLANGEYRETVAEGSASELVVRLLDVVMGDLDGDGLDDAAVILATDPGGSGTFYDLAAVVYRQGTAVHVATEALGDRIRLLDVDIDASRILVEMVVHETGDPLCCPSLWVTRTYSLDGSRLLRHSDLLVRPAEVDPSGLVDVRWMWTALIGPDDSLRIDVVDSALYTLELSEDGTYHVKADCNLASGAYALDGWTLSLASGPTTLALCPPASLSSEYLRYLGGAEEWRLQDGRLFLTLAHDGGTMIFEQAPASIVGVMWKWTGLIETMPASQSVVPHPERYTLILHSMGTLNLRADCNRVMGAYALDGHDLRIELGPSTRAYCGEESLDFLYLDLLSRVESYEIVGEQLVLVLADNAGRMFFEPESAPITGIPWHWHELIETLPAAQTVVPHPERYTLVFEPDNTLTLQADCNRVLATYSLSPTDLQIQLGPSTQAYCGEESLDLLYLDLLSRVETYEVLEGQLVLILANRGGRMFFRRGE